GAGWHTAPHTRRGLLLACTPAGHPEPAGLPAPTRCPPATPRAGSGAGPASGPHVGRGPHHLSDAGHPPSRRGAHDETDADTSTRPSRDAWPGGGLPHAGLTTRESPARSAPPYPRRPQ